MLDGAGFAELGPGTQGRLLLWLLLFATAAAPVVFRAHAAALLVLGAQISAVKSLGAAETQMRHIGKLKLETLAAFQACVRGRPCLVSKHHTHVHHMITQPHARPLCLHPLREPPSAPRKRTVRPALPFCPDLGEYSKYAKRAPIYPPLSVPASFRAAPQKLPKGHPEERKTPHGAGVASPCPSPQPTQGPRAGSEPTYHSVCCGI